jgi:hypothetical protein
MTENLDDRLAEARAWLQECFNDHRACDQRTVEWPRRVLDTADETIRLITSASLSQTETEQAGYACLSYAWGTSGNLKTLKENLEAHQRGIDVVSLPRTLSEAVYVCKSMRIRYLWIDALCIIQDDTQDWKTQIHKMASIVSHLEIQDARETSTDIIHQHPVPRRRTSHLSTISNQRSPRFSLPRPFEKRTLQARRSPISDARQHNPHSQALNPRRRAPRLHQHTSAPLLPPRLR